MSDKVTLHTLYFRFYTYALQLHNTVSKLGRIYCPKSLKRSFFFPSSLFWHWCVTGDVLYELLQHILKQRKPHSSFPNMYYPGSSFHSLPDAALQHHKLEGECLQEQMPTLLTDARVYYSLNRLHDIPFTL